MLNFIPLNDDVLKIKNFIDNSPISFCDISLGVKYMWRDSFKIEYATINDTIILKESCKDYQNAFYYPVGKNADEGLFEIEKYCKEKNLPLKFCCIDNTYASLLTQRYLYTRVYNLREWSDYIYDKETFIKYSGKHLSGQRNHVNKFKKLFPNFIFKRIEKDDLKRIKDFLKEVECENPIDSWTAQKEEESVFDLVQKMWDILNFGGEIIVDDKIVAISVGEIVGDTLIVHIEKALKGYEGIYPTLAQCFATEFCNDNVKYINREEDCGDMGLRTSKLQYHPINIKEKNIVEVFTAFDKIDENINLQTERLTITKINKEDKEDYASIYLDDDLNKFWGYDYREDIATATPDGDYFYNFQNCLKEKKEEFSFAIKLNGKMIGDIVFHNFTFNGSLEIGFRLKREYQHNGYCIEATKKMIQYAFDTLLVNEINCCHYIENKDSEKVIKALKMEFTYSDKIKKYYRLKKTP